MAKRNTKKPGADVFEDVVLKENGEDTIHREIN
jgi:hypothetical protein